MKKLVKVLVLFFAITAFATLKSQAQDVVISARLYRPHEVVMPPRPTPHHVWVAEEWVPRGGTYVYREGYWAQPPRPHAVWVAGRWKHHHHGYVWVGGYWR